MPSRRDEGKSSLFLYLSGQDETRTGPDEVMFQGLPGQIKTDMQF